LAQFETFGAYFGRLLTWDVFLWIGGLMLLAFLLRKPLARSLQVSHRRFLLIALSFAGVVGLSLRFWEAYGTWSVFWLIAPEVWSEGFRFNANFVLNLVLYIPPAILLVLARQASWMVGLILIGMSFAVETIQQYARIGSGDPFDLFANTLGALIGVTIGLATIRLWPALGVKR
jgi:hypothetical protein